MLGLDGGRLSADEARENDRKLASLWAEVESACGKNSGLVVWRLRCSVAAVWAPARPGTCTISGATGHVVTAEVLDTAGKSWELAINPDLAPWIDTLLRINSLVVLVLNERQQRAPFDLREYGAALVRAAGEASLLALSALGREGAGAQHQVAGNAVALGNHAK